MDAELIAYLDERFAEVRTAIATSAESVKSELRSEIAASADSVKAELRAEIAGSADSVKAELRAEIAASADSVKAELRSEIATSAERLRGEIAASAERLRVEISAQTARHIDVVVESLITRMEWLAEGVRTVDHRLDRFSDEVRVEFQKVDRRLLRLHARVVSGRRRRPGR